MAISLQWWHWLAFGLVLIGAELLVPSFTIFWFGLGAILTGLMVLLFPELSLAGQLVLFGVFSVAWTIFWFRILKPRMIDRSLAGMSGEAILGEQAFVIKGTLSPQDKGRIRFTVPLLGSEEWTCRCEETLQAGDQVRVSGMVGHVLTVEKM